MGHVKGKVGAGVPNCEELMTKDRASGVHELLTRLLGECTCGRSEDEILDLYGVADRPMLLRAV